MYETAIRTMSETEIQELRPRFRGELITPADAAYDAARKVYNAMVEQKNEDPFWAVRGGNGNFGVATSFLFRARPVGTVYGGPIFWPMDKGSEVLRFWHDFILEAPEDMNGWFGPPPSRGMR